VLKILELHIENFKNLSKIDITFDSNIVCFCGENGAGKTNLLDALNFLSIGKSNFPGTELKNITHGQQYFNLKQKCSFNSQISEIFIGYVNGGRKKIKVNNIEYERFAGHVGRFPSVMVTPYDINLIDDGSAERRKFLDRLIAQTDYEYLEHLIRYEKTLAQRNAQLKLMKEKNQFNRKLLFVYNDILSTCALPVYTKRKAYIEEIKSLVTRYYFEISLKKEGIDVSYDSQLNNKSMSELLASCIESDLIQCRTVSGIHRDDIVVSINNYPAQRFASQGQKKSIVLALKMAEFEIIKKRKGFKPILLLDDLNDRLDKSRINNLMKMIASGDFGQVFITDTDKDHLRITLDSLNCNYQLITVSAGTIVCE